MPSALVGCSGWSYATWRPKFYPEGMRPKDFLAFYAAKFATIEINYTFNHLPTEKNVATWLGATDQTFRFGLKASQLITHRAQLREPARTLPPFFDRARMLGPRLGPILFQTPRWVRRDDDRLAMFLAALPRDVRCVLEVRDTSWYTEEVYELMRTANVALVHAEGEKAPSPVDTIERTADFAYVRLRAREGYPDDSVDAWAARLRAVMAGGRDVYAYFRHDEDGSNALSALRLRKALA
ncbi:MAG TPA: DUF72 domain-containing protein [Methylomirabilota bacterium]|nr:DUF72 domain-containing protein [Methylomirabilota bacterium]